MLARSVFRLLPLLITAALLVGAPVSVPAQSIRFTFTGRSGSGTLDGVGFTDKAVTFTAIGSVADRQSYAGGFFVDHLAASVQIEDVGSFDFLTGTRTFIATSSRIVGLTRQTGADLFDGILDPTGAPWDMTTSIGPLAYTANFLQWGLSDVVTTGGVLLFDSRGTSATFEAVVPEPHRALLLLTGGTLLLLVALRRRSRARAHTSW